MNVLLILKHSYDLFSKQISCTFCLTFMGVNDSCQFCSEHWQCLPVNQCTCDPTVKKSQRSHLNLHLLQTLVGKIINKKNCMCNLASISIKVPNDLSLSWAHRHVEDSTSPFLSSGIPWGVFCSSFTHTDPLKHLQQVKSYSLSLKIVQNLIYRHSCPQKSSGRYSASFTIIYTCDWLWLFPSCSSLISLH